MKSIWHILESDSPEEALHIATANSRLEDMRELIATGVDVNARHKTIMSGQSLDAPLHIAATYGLFEPARLLVDAGADLNLIGGMDLTALMCACSCGGAEGDQIAQLLVERGADVTIVRESDGMTALKFAAKECGSATITALIIAGADVDGPPNTDHTALMLAARGNNVPAIEVLVKYGADPQRGCGLRWALGKTAAWMAQNEGSVDAFTFLNQLQAKEERNRTKP